MELSPPEPGLTQVGTTWIAVAAIAAIAIVPLLHLAGPHEVGVAWSWLVLQIVPGIAVCIWCRGIDRVTFAVYAIVGSAVVDALLGLVMVRVDLWHPYGADLLVDGGSLASLLLALQLRGRRPRPALPRLPRAELVTVALTGLGVALVVVGTPWSVEPGRAGLVGLVGPAWWCGMVALLAAFVYALSKRASLAAPTCAAAVVVVLAQAIAYARPTVVVSARHVGIIESLAFHGRALWGADIYQAWVSFFAGQAWTGAGIGNWFAYAAWWPVFASLGEVLAVRMLAGRFLSPRRAWAAALIFILANSLNTPYFSPQVYVFAPALVIIALLLHRPEPEGRTAAIARWTAIATTSLLVITAHELTPYLLVCVLVVLVVMRAVRPWWAPLGLLVLSAAWALLNRAVLGRYLSVSTLGNLFGNLAPPQHGTPVLPPQWPTELTFYLPALALLVVGAVGVVALVQHRRERLFWLLALSAAAPAFVALGTDYGGEGIFRIALFALPWLGMLAVRVQTPAVLQRIPAIANGRHVRTVAVSTVSAGIAVLMAVNVIGLAGMDWARTMRPGTIAVEQYFELHAPDNALLFTAGTGRVTPSEQTRRYLNLQFLSREDLGGDGSTGFPTQTGARYNPAADIRDWTARVTAIPASAHYALFSDETGAAGERYRNQSYADYMRLWAAMSHARGWRLVGRTDSAALYEWTGRAAH